ncbi:MAG: rhodanese-like domain-containing protein [Flavobacteriales bacterium]|nr:rhodanese-like domain-containing protein [Flavobacteriales bacterium]
MKEISVSELKAMRNKNEDHQLIDVREIHEIEICTINGTHIPMGEIMARNEEVRKDIPVIIHCRSGQRSSAVVNALEANFGFTNLHNLTGGILAWASQIDTTLEQY